MIKKRDSRVPHFLRFLMAAVWGGLGIIGVSGLVLISVSPASLLAADEIEGDMKGWAAPADINKVEGVQVRASGGGSVAQNPEGLLVLRTENADQFAFVSFGSASGFDAAEGEILEIEFDMRVDHTVAKRDGACMVQVFGYPVNGQPRRIDLIFDNDNVRFFSGVPKANDASKMRTYLLRISPDRSELFVKGLAEPVVWTATFGNNLDNSLNELRIGDISANDSIAGSSTWRKLLWKGVTTGSAY